MLEYAIVFGLGLLVGHFFWWRPKLERRAPARKQPQTVRTKIGEATIETTVNPREPSWFEQCNREFDQAVARDPKGFFEAMTGQRYTGDDLWLDLPCPPHCGLRNYPHTHKVYVEVSEFAWCTCGDQKGVHLQDGCGICKKCKDFELDPSRPPATASNISHWNVHLVSTASDEPCVNCGDAYVMHDAAGCHQNTRLEHCPCPGFARKAARL